MIDDHKLSVEPLYTSWLLVSRNYYKPAGVLDAWAMYIREPSRRSRSGKRQDDVIRSLSASAILGLYEFLVINVGASGSEF
jgi:hypothetical protein